MHWILQTNLFQEAEWTRLVETLEKFDLPYSVHRVVPFIGELEPIALCDKFRRTLDAGFFRRTQEQDHGPGIDN